jgi:hypothetical protein
MASSKPFTDSMTYYPTLEELKDFKTYVQRLEQDGAGRYGIVKIVPPKDWFPGLLKGILNGETGICVYKPLLQMFLQVSL